MFLPLPLVLAKEIGEQLPHAQPAPVAGVSVCVISKISCLVSCSLRRLFNQFMHPTTVSVSLSLSPTPSRGSRCIQLVDRESHLI